MHGFVENSGLLPLCRIGYEVATDWLHYSKLIIARTWTKCDPYTWPIHIIRCKETAFGGVLLKGKMVMFCFSDKQTNMTLYLLAMA